MFMDDKKQKHIESSQQIKYTYKKFNKFVSVICNFDLVRTDEKSSSSFPLSRPHTHDKTVPESEKDK